MKQCSPPSVPMHPNKPPQQKQPWRNASNSLTTWHPIRKQSSHTKPEKWYLQSIAMSPMSKPKACSQAGGHMFMAGQEEIPTINGMVLNILQIIRAVMSSAAEAKLGVLFINAKTAVSMHRTLKELVHPQMWTLIQTNNSTAHALLTNKFLPKALKSMDMQFHWLRCRSTQNQYWYYWRPETQI